MSGDGETAQVMRRAAGGVTKRQEVCDNGRRIRKLASFGRSLGSGVSHNPLNFGFSVLYDL
jgi:hypothetical protein